MDLDDDELTTEDLLFLDAEVQKEIDKHNDTSRVRLPKSDIQIVTDVDFIPNTQFLQMISDCFDDDDGTEAQMEHLECLRSKFKHGSFREKQWDIINALSEKRDVCAVMATGYGKSLCFQFPAVYMNKMTLVVSPLIALMQAQVMDLKMIGISACMVGSAQTDLKILNRIADGNFTVVYSSPEYLQTANGDKLMSIVRGKLALIAIDEAHCVSQWGHDFRPDFRKLNDLRLKLPGTPILAVTATATENVRRDIISLLGLIEPRVVMTSFDRSNLEFVVKHKTTVRNDLPQLIKHVDGSVIVYVLKRKVAEEIAKQLREENIICEHYHAGLDISKRTEVLDSFLKDGLKVIVATIAFGMGIDKKDIRCVIHYGASKNLETYYQEVGRAGRDGKAAKVITFFSVDDFELHDWFLEDETAKKDLSPIIKNYLRSLAAKMRDFLYSTQCRRKIILGYFGENTILAPRPNCCDNCTVGLCSWKLTDLYEDVDENGIYDFAGEAKVLLEAIKCLERNHISTEKNLLKKFLIGKFDQRLRGVQRERCYASGQMHPEQYWVALTEQLMQSDFVDMVPNTIKLTLSTQAEDWLKNPANLHLKAIGQMFEYFEKKQATPLVIGLNKANRYTVTRAVTELARKDYVLSDELLKQILNQMRDAISVSKNVPQIESIATMIDLEKMVKAKPRNFDELRYTSLAAFNEEKLNKYGPTFVNVISKFTSGELEMQNALLNHPMPNVKMEHVISPQILRLLKDRKNKDEILQLTNLTEDQLYSDIETLIQTGQPVLKTDLAYISHIDFKLFRQCIDEQNVNDTTDITPELLNEIETKYFNSSSHRIDAGFTRLGIVYHTVRFHLNRLCVSYVDCDENFLVNAEQLIVQERPKTSTNIFQTDRQYLPLRRNHHIEPTFLDLIFGGNFIGGNFQYESENDYDMDSEEYEHWGSDYSGQSNDRSDSENGDDDEEDIDDSGQSHDRSDTEIGDDGEEDNDDSNVEESEEEADSENQEENGSEESSATDVSSEGSASDVNSDGSDNDFDHLSNRKRPRLM